MRSAMPDFVHGSKAATTGNRPYPPTLVAQVRTLIEQAGLSQREAAARTGIGVDTVGRWARRFGWRRGAVPPPGPAGEPGRAREPEAGRSPAGADPEGAGARPGSPVGGAPSLRLAATRPPVRGGRRGRSCGRRRGCASRGRGTGWSGSRSSSGSPGGRCIAGASNSAGSGRRRRTGAGRDSFRARRLGRPYGGDAVGTARDLVTGSRLPLRPHRGAGRREPGDPVPVDEAPRLDAARARRAPPPVPAALWAGDRGGGGRIVPDDGALDPDDRRPRRRDARAGRALGPPGRLDPPAAGPARAHRPAPPHLTGGAPPSPVDAARPPVSGAGRAAGRGLRRPAQRGLAAPGAGVFAGPGAGAAASGAAGRMGPARLRSSTT